MFNAAAPFVNTVFAEYFKRRSVMKNRKQDKSFSEALGKLCISLSSQASMGKVLSNMYVSFTYAVS